MVAAAGVSKPRVRDLATTSAARKALLSLLKGFGNTDCGKKFAKDGITVAELVGDVGRENFFDARPGSQCRIGKSG